MACKYICIWESDTYSKSVRNAIPFKVIWFLSRSCQQVWKCRDKTRQTSFCMRFFAFISIKWKQHWPDHYSIMTTSSTTTMTAAAVASSPNWINMWNTIEIMQIICAYANHEEIISFFPFCPARCAAVFWRQTTYTHTHTVKQKEKRNRVDMMIVWIYFIQKYI